MGTPRIYYYPDDTGTLETVNLGETLSDLIDDQEVIGGQSTGDGGVLQRTVDGTFWRVRVLLSRFGTSPGNDELERQLQSFTSHAQRGGPFIFSRDHDKTYAVKLASAPARGATSLTATSATACCSRCQSAVSPARLRAPSRSRQPPTKSPAAARSSARRASCSLI